MLTPVFPAAGAFETSKGLIFNILYLMEILWI